MGTLLGVKSGLIWEVLGRRTHMRRQASIRMVQHNELDVSWKCEVDIGF